MGALAVEGPGHVATRSIDARAGIAFVDIWNMCKHALEVEADSSNGALSSFCRYKQCVCVSIFHEPHVYWNATHLVIMSPHNDLDCRLKMTQKNERMWGSTNKWVCVCVCVWVGENARCVRAHLRRSLSRAWRRILSDTSRCRSRECFCRGRCHKAGGSRGTRWYLQGGERRRWFENRGQSRKV